MSAITVAAIVDASFIIKKRTVPLYCQQYCYNNKTQQTYISHFGPIITTTSTCTMGKNLLPSLIVFDLDDCLWTPEMHELPGCPEIPIHGNLIPVNTNNSNGRDSMKKGVVGLQVPPCHRGRGRGRHGGQQDDTNSTVTLYDGARKVLYELATNPMYKDVQLATASSSLAPSYSYACLDGIEILPGLVMGDMMNYNQIGRTGNLSPDKTSHFQRIHEESGGIPYQEMLFFDDCNWGNHCERVSKAFGVVSQRTPHGLQWEEFENGLSNYQQIAKSREPSSESSSS